MLHELFITHCTNGTLIMNPFTFSPRNDSFTLEDSRIQIYPQFCNLQQTSGYRDYFQHRHTKEVFSFICFGQGKEFLFTKGWQIPNLHVKL